MYDDHLEEKIHGWIFILEPLKVSCLIRVHHPDSSSSLVFLDALPDEFPSTSYNTYVVDVMLLLISLLGSLQSVTLTTSLHPLPTDRSDTQTTSSVLSSIVTLSSFVYIHPYSVTLLILLHSCLRPASIPVG